MNNKDKRSLLVGVVREHYSSLRGYLIKKLRSHDDAEDVVQESFLRLRSVKNFDTIDNPKAYLYRTANNLIAERGRKSRRVESVNLEWALDAGILEEEDAASDPAVLASARQELHIVSAAIMGLPERCRRAFILKKIYNLSLKEIAREMGISEKTVEKHISKGLLACHEGLTHASNNNVVSFSKSTSGE